MFHFFFSSRRRHTRSLCDWSSDVCSSDLVVARTQGHAAEALAGAAVLTPPLGPSSHRMASAASPCFAAHMWSATTRSEERRVGKECRSRLSPYRYKRKQHNSESETSTSSS